MLFGQKQEGKEVRKGGLRVSDWGIAFSLQAVRPDLRGLSLEREPCIHSWFRSLSSDSMGVLYSLNNSLPNLGLTWQPHTVQSTQACSTAFKLLSLDTSERKAWI